MHRLRADLREHGFAVFEGALDPQTTARIRERVLEQGAAERRNGHGTRNLSVEPDDDVNQWVAFLPNKGKVFRTLINNARALETVRFILGEHAILSEFSAHVTWPGNREMPLHIDQWFMPHPVEPDERLPARERRPPERAAVRRPGHGPPSDQSAGGLQRDVRDHRLHRRQRRNPPGARQPPFGSASRARPGLRRVLRRGSCRWLRRLGGPDLARGESQQGGFPRVGITTYWSAPFIRQLLNFPYGLRPEVADALTEHERALMGFKAWETYGTSDEFGSAWARPGKDNTGELR